MQWKYQSCERWTLSRSLHSHFFGRCSNP